MGLKNDTLALLADKKHAPGFSLRAISQSAGVNYEWLRRFGAGRIPNPGVDTVQRLHDYLTSPPPGAGTPGLHDAPGE